MVLAAYGYVEVSERVRLAVYLKAHGLKRQANGPGTVGRDVGPTGGSALATAPTAA